MSFSSVGCNGWGGTASVVPFSPSIPFNRSKDTESPLEIFMATSNATVLFFLVIMLRSVESGMPHVRAASDIDRSFSFNISWRIE